MNLYWLSTPDNYENWFVFAKSEKLAQEFHEMAEGFGENYAKSQFVCKIPKEISKKYALQKLKSDWPSHEMIAELGGKIISLDNPRIVNFFGKVFIEGTCTEGIFFNNIKEKAGVYIIKVQKTEKYKIGITINIKKRLKQFATGNPFNLKLLYFMSTKEYKSLEKHLHEKYKNQRIKGEWFNFTEHDLIDLELTLDHLDNMMEEFTLYNIKSASEQGRVFE